MANVFNDGFSVVGPVSQDAIERFGELVPLRLEAAWKQDGLVQTSDGFIRTIDPVELLPVMDTILPALPDAVPLFATAWGDLVVMQGDRLVLVLFRLGFYKVFIDAVSAQVFDELERVDIQRDVLVRGNYDQAVSVLGVPDIDECFGYVLPLALGGAEDVSNIARRKLKEHLVFLAQSAGPPRSLDELDPPRSPEDPPASGASSDVSVDPELDRPAASTPQESTLVERGTQLLGLLNPDADYDYTAWPEDRAVYVWQTGFGGGQIVVGEDGSVLFGNSSLWADPMREAWRAGKRTAPEAFETPGEEQR